MIFKPSNFISFILSTFIFISSIARAEFTYIAPNLLAEVPVMTISGEPLSSAVAKIVPPGFTVTYGPGVSKNEKIQWEAGPTWPIVLKKALKPAGLQYERDGTSIYISKIPVNFKTNSPATGWSVKKEERLSKILEFWGQKAGVRVQFLTDRDWQVEQDYKFKGSFENAVRSLLEALSDSNPAPVGELTNKRRTLLILNRSED